MGFMEPLWVLFGIDAKNQEAITTRSPQMLLPIIGLLGVCLFACVMGQEGHHGNHQRASGHHHHTPRNIYIDLGTNDGASISSFINQLQSQGVATDGSSAVKGGWAALINTSRTLDTWDVIAIEANEEQTPRVRRIQTKLLAEQKVRSMVFYNGTAIGCKDGTVEFIWDSPTIGQAGSTIMSESKSAVGKVVSVPMLDIVTLFRKEHIHVNDFVVVKMDIEGAEYDLVRRILLTNIWKFIDKLAVEW